jgi:YYY domain-containing protein
MELAFITSILRSPVFPPADPWLSGYAISYYYFGYVMVAMLARLSAASGGVAFNLALITWFAMTATAAYGLLYELLSLRTQVPLRVLQDGLRRSADHLWALFAPLFLLIVSNLEGFLEMLHARGLFWKQDAAGIWTSAVWQWLNIQEIVQPPAQPFSWMPNRPGGIWWWRASRVLQDFDFIGQPREIIDEFPAFSFALGDLHPHVLAMPFALLAAALALNVFLRIRTSGQNTETGRLELRKWLCEAEYWLAALILGGLAFLNTWDGPIYLALFAAAAFLASYLRDGLRWSLVAEFLVRCLVIGLSGILLYLPFYIGFSSQAGGILPSLVFFTRGISFWIMFGSLLLPVTCWLVWRWTRNGNPPALYDGLLVGLALIAGLWLVSNLYGFYLLRTQPNLAGIYGAAPGAPLVQDSTLRRLAQPGMWISLLLLLGLVWGLFRSFRRPDGEKDVSEAGELPLAPFNRADPFILLLVLIGLGLVIFPEFFYLRDQFGWRMNTIFKFYFQAWIVWAVAAAYAAVVLWQEIRARLGAVIFRVGLVLLLGMALVYPYFAIPARAGLLDPANWTLDGSTYLPAEELEAIQWLRSAPYGIVAEAVGGSYSGFARVSTHSGLPAVLGWDGHESQWRGGAVEMGTRKPDIAELYRAKDWSQAKAVIEKYNIRYITLGSLERSEYRPDELLFDQNLSTVFRNASITIYEVTPSQSQGQAANP